MTLVPETRLALALGCRLREVEGQSPMLLMPEAVVRLRGAGAEIVRRIGNGRTFGELLGELHAAFPEGGERLERETEEFVRRLHEKRIIEITAPEKPEQRVEARDCEAPHGMDSSR
jgi:Coenzyme PQQ synthesis protein D (PqqD)